MTYCSYCFAQTKETSPPVIDVYPKSPDVAALGKFGDVPVGLHTGVATVTVPVWEIKLKDLSIPVSLGYHSSGIKVNEMASSAGLGWAMQTGGVVSCSINGLPDIGPGVDGKPIFTNFGWPNAPYKTPQTGPLTTSWPGNPYFQSDPTFLYFHENGKDRNDTEPDLFSVNYGANSVKFYFDQEKNIHLVPFRRLKISMTTDGFTLIDEKDNKFEFNTPEISTTTSQIFGEDYLSRPKSEKSVSYHLTRITTPSGEIVRYTYLNTSGTFNNQNGETRYAPNGISGCSGLLPNSRVTTSSTNGASNVVSSIVSSVGDSLIFSYVNDRLDVSTSPRLSSINVFSKTSPLTSFTFSHSYFLSPGGTSATPSYNRLKLQSVTQAGKSPYLFNYNPLQLPKRLSFCQDHWGYFNESYNDDSPSPTLLPVDLASGFYTGADREMSANGVFADMLTQVTYPTGGKSVFTYEKNDMFVTEALPLAKPARTTEYANTSSVRNVNFVIPTGAYDIEVYYVTNSEPTEDIQGSFGPYTVIQFKQSSSLIRQFSGSNYSGEPLSLSPGTYTAKICADPNAVGVYFEIRYWIEGESTTQTVSSNKVLGGVRIKEISDYASAEEEPVVTKYEYKQFGNQARSSGRGNAYPSYVYSHNVQNLGDIGIQSCTFNCQSSGSLIPLNTIQGANVFYDEVRVYKKDKNLYGYTDTKFFPGGQSDGSLKFPFTPIISYEWLDGLISEKTEYKFVSAGNFTPVSKTVSTYKTQYGTTLTTPNESFVRGIKPALIRPAFSGALGSYFQYPEYMVESFYLYTSWSYPIKTMEITYDPSDSTKKVTVVKDFHFDNPSHLEMTSMEVSNSSGDQQKSLMRYPLDINPAYPYNSSPVVESRQLLRRGGTDYLLSADLTLYKSGKGAFPSTIYRYSPNSAVLASSLGYYSGGTVPLHFEKRVEYSYGTDSNIVKSVKDGVQKSGYKWGYGGVYPVAICSNADQNEFYYEGFEDSGFAPSNSHTGLRSSNGAYTLNWTRPNGRNYVISYWYLDGTIWRYREQPYTTTTLVLTLGSAYDDIRIHPTDSQMNTYTFDSRVGLSSKTDANSITVYFEYDNAKRLQNVKDQNGDIVRNFDYHYKP